MTMSLPMYCRKPVRRKDSPPSSAPPETTGPTGQKGVFAPSRTTSLRSWRPRIQSSHFQRGITSLTKRRSPSTSCEAATSTRLSQHGNKFHAAYDHNAHPMAPPGVKVLAFEDADTRETWAPHGRVGYYVGPAMQHYRCFRIYMAETKRIRIVDTLSWHPAQLLLPGTSPSMTFRPPPGTSHVLCSGAPTPQPSYEEKQKEVL